tara:strand:- start:624 stop:956 length:333 start_codon:yes stop_codon:yes gene_type:complete
MVVVFDTRPTAFGDMIIVTGTYDAGDDTIDLSGFMKTIDGFNINSTATTANVAVFAGPESGSNTDAQFPDTFQLAVEASTGKVGTTVTLYGGVTDGAQEPGKFVAFGRRG